MIYLDNNATTQVDRHVLEKMNLFHIEHYGNPNAVHSMGVTAARAMEESRRKIARLIESLPSEVYFTSSATEAINWAIRSSVYFRGKRSKVVASSIEHKAVLNTIRDLANTEGIVVEKVRPGKGGIVSTDELMRHVDDNTFMVCLMAVNNVLGTIQPYEEVADALLDKDVFYLVDAVQTIGKIPFSVRSAKCSFAAFSAHKFHGPKGVGTLFINSETRRRPFITGGGQESGMRSGTQDVAGIVGMAEAMEIATTELDRFVPKMRELRNYVASSVRKLGGVINGDMSRSIPNMMNISFPNIKGEVLANALSDAGVCVATSSACSARSESSQRILEDSGIPPEIASGAIRVSMSRFTTLSQVESFIEILSNVVTVLQI
ncbi:MAG TPA: cysteine desulfurase [Kosmotogaceae bacterium]|nr:MAG: Cysteine desulfurase [Thermotogales bacterium 46_20]HAA85087.1 cysteine desulfurase [Kosmotogaceae bacterium]